jgi:anti-sigma factor RsiW
MAASGVNCSEIRVLISALVDGEATAEEAARAEVHIALCEACASHRAFLRLTNRALRQVPDLYASASLSARIAAATYDRPSIARRIQTWLRPAPTRVAIGTALAAGIAGVVIIPRLGMAPVASVPGPYPSDAPQRSAASAISPASGVIAPAAAGVPNVASSSHRTSGGSGSVGAPIVATAAPSETSSVSVAEPAMRPAREANVRHSAAVAFLPDAVAQKYVEPGSLSERGNPVMDRHFARSGGRGSRASLSVRQPTAAETAVLSGTPVDRSGPYDRSVAVGAEPREASVVDSRPSASSAASESASTVPASAVQIASSGDPASNSSSENLTGSAASVVGADHPTPDGAVADSAAKPLLFHLTHRTAGGTGSIAIPTDVHRDASGQGTNDAYQFAHSPAGRASVVGLPVD